MRFLTAVFGHRALDGWRGRGRPRPQCWWVDGIRGNEMYVWMYLSDGHT